MSLRCPNCGEALIPDLRFCPTCGQALSDEAAQLVQKRTPRLVIRVTGKPDREVVLNRSTFTLGRLPDNDIVIPEPYISSHHGRLDLKEGSWQYTDLNSTNGTYVNGRRALSAALLDGDILRIGDPQGNSTSLTFTGGNGGAQAGQRTLGAVKMGSTALKMMMPVLAIGRNPKSDIPLEAPIVSWAHARLERTDQGAILTDLNSTNGTYVNGYRLTRPALLRDGDVVQIGPFTLVYSGDTLQRYAATAGVRLDGVRLIREVGPKERRKRILNDISVSIAPREFVALVGTSGAGKSTLMMALNGFNRADGQVLVNGDDLYQHFDLYRTMVGYVPQDDIIHKDLTVVSALRYAALLRLPPDTSEHEIQHRIDEVLEMVEMIGQKEQLVTSLSGGQRKRVSIAVELLAEPNLFFLDEPTSGLDPGLEKKMMLTMRRLADGGRTVVLVTHATANIVQCDHVCFLSQGRLVYFGPPQKVQEFFGVTTGDFADVYGMLDDPDPKVAREKAAQWEQKFKQSEYYRQYVVERQQQLPEVQKKAAIAPARQRSKVNVLRQFWVLTRRYMDLVLRDKLLLSVLMAVMPIIGALVLLVSDTNWLVGNTLPEIEKQLAEGIAGGASSTTYSVIYNSQVMLFILALASVLLGLFASVYEIVKEWSVYQRERMVSVRILPYLASKVVVLGVFALIQCFLLLLVVSFRVELPRDGVFLPGPLEIYITLVLGTVAAIMLGLLISALVPNTNAVIYIVFLVLFFQLIFAGVLFDLPGVTKPLSSFTLTRWSMEALGSSSDIEGLNRLTRTRFQPDPVTQVVSTDVEKPADDWEPVTVVTVTQEITVPIQPGLVQTVPISVPQVTVNDMVTVTETVTESITVEPDATDIYSEEEFQIDYARTPAHLFFSWALLIVFGMIFGGATAFVLRRKDVG